MITSDNPLFPLTTRDPNGASESVQLIARTDAQVLARYLGASLADSTRRAYAADVAAFMAAGGALPATPVQVARYLAREGPRLSPYTLARRLVALSRAHRVSFEDDPCRTELVRATLQGVRRVHGTRQRRVEPLLGGQLATIVRVLPDSIRGLRDRAVLLVGFASALRRSEMVSLQVEDLADAPDGLALLVRRSKTDQEGRGRTVVVPETGSALCPVTALRQWLSRSGITAGALFRSLDKAGRVRGGLSAQSVALIVKQAAHSIGLPASRYAGHSLRAGFVSSAAHLGLGERAISQQSGHRSETILRAYIRGPGIAGAEVAKAVCSHG